MASALDAYDIPPATYLTWTKFTFPDKNGGRTAIAVSQAESRIITALYTLLITITFSITWDIVLTLLTILFAPKRMTRTNHITMIAAWNTSDALHVLPMLMKHAWSVFRGIIGKVHEIEFTWEAFGLDAVILLFALGGWGGGVAAGLKFPELLVIGTAAPVNPSSVLYPNFTQPGDSTFKLQFLAVSRYDRRRSMRAIASVEGYETEVSKFVQFTRIEEADIYGEQRYKMKYGYKVTGLDMGLQHLSHLTLVVTGQCTFENSWYNGTRNTTIERGFVEDYLLWPKDSSRELDGVADDNYNIRLDIAVGPRIPPFAKFVTVKYIETEKGNSMNEETGTSYYTVTPSTAFRVSHTNGSDAWYATQKLPPIYKSLSKDYKFQVKPGRPPLKCREDTDWSYKNWRGKTANLFSTEDDKPPVTIPEAIKYILWTTLIEPVVVTLGRSSSVGLKSTSDTFAPDNAIDTETASAANDMRRLVHAAFVLTRDLFREAAIAGAAAAAANDSSIPNVLETADGYMPGTGDFIMISRNVVALNVSQMAVVPSALVFLLLIATALYLARKRTELSSTQAPGRWQRFVLYASGLQAAQLYRLLDQALANDYRPPIWSRKRGRTPVVSGESPNDLPIPELQVVSRAGPRNQKVAELEDPHVAEFVIGLRPASQYKTSGLENKATDSSCPLNSVANNAEPPDPNPLDKVEVL
ncbi:hypothetical protein BDZ91DRAFT_848095 [Kalaharituber pfeilii]|nr:hypothetical protein BDZ91DRAFT_848095 [Kalaharituber pfeilii]